MRKKYGDLKCATLGRNVIIKLPVWPLDEDIDTIMMMAGTWVLEEMCMECSDPVIASEIIAKRLRKHVEQMVEEEPVG